MPELTPGARRAMPYWGTIEHAATEGLGTAELWDAIRAAAGEAGLDSPGVSAADVAQLYGRAVSIQNREGRLDRADDAERMDDRYVSQAPWQRDQAQRDALAQWQVRFEHTVLGPEGPETNWRTSFFTGSLPDTKEALLEALHEDADKLSRKYAVSHIGLGSIQVLEV